MIQQKIYLTSAELKALQAALRYGEAPLEFIVTAINSEISRREGRPRRGLRAARILVKSQHELSKKLEEIEITVSLRVDE